jgi:hypothetical protein
VLLAVVLVALGGAIVGLGELGYNLGAGLAASSGGPPPSAPWVFRCVGGALIVVGLLGPIAWFFKGAARCARCGQRLVTAGEDCPYCGEPLG